MIKLWVDDEREMPRDYTHHAKNYEEAIKILETGDVYVVSLDHDLGYDEAGVEKNGYDISCWIEAKAKENKIPKIIWKVHSANPVGSKCISLAMKQAEKYWEQNYGLPF